MEPKKDRTYLLHNGSMAKVLRLDTRWIWAHVQPPDGTQHRERFTVADFARQIAGRTTPAARAAWKLASVRLAIMQQRRVTKAATRRTTVSTRAALTA